jgi:DNA-binding transcriptional LysR family regulator
MEAAAASHPALGAAADALNVKQFTLVGQINRLERDLGGPLLERAVRRRPMRITALGKRVKRAISKAIPVPEAIQAQRRPQPSEGRSSPHPGIAGDGPVAGR